MRFNPFNPLGLISPGMFAGREDVLEKAVKCLFQTKHENPQHFLLQGERGIGKSSLLLAIDVMASDGLSGDPKAPLDFLVVSVDLAGCNSQIEIIRAIATELKGQLDASESVRSKAKAIWEWLSNWEILGVRYHKHPEEYDPRDAATDLVNRLAEFCALGVKDGVVILIDEADRPAETANLGEFIKVFTERLVRKKCRKVVVGMAGLPTIISKLKASHESSPRVFHMLHVPILEPSDRKKVVREGLKIAKERNKRTTRIDAEALDLISELSEGYPHFVQQFAFSAFEADDDDNIDKEDVVNGAIDALRQLGDKYFSDMYQTRTVSPDYRRVLDSMAKHGDDWVPKQTIIKESGVKEVTMNNALRALRARGAIVLDEARPGFYKIATKSFAAWINAVRTALPQRRANSQDLFED